MKTYTITLNERNKKAKELLAFIKKLAESENSIFLEELAISPTHKKTYNKNTQKAIKVKKTYKADSVDSLFNSI